MSSMELKRKESLTRQEAANWLAAFAIALAHGGQAQVDLGGTTLRLHVQEDVRTEFEVEIHGEEVEVDIELKWSTVPIPTTHNPTTQNPAVHNPTTQNPAARTPTAQPVVAGSTPAA